MLANVGWGGLSVADQIATLAGQMAPGTPPRLQALRLAPFGRTTPLVAQVRRVDAPGGALVLIVAPALRGFVPPPAPELPPAPALDPTALERARRADDGPRYDVDDEDGTPDATVEAVAATVAPAPAPAADVATTAEPIGPAEAPPELPPALDARAAALAARTRPLRFGWSVGADGQLDYVTPEAVAALGADAMPRAFEGFSAFIARTGIDPDGALAAALDSGEAFSDRAVSWPISGSARRADVVLSAAPTAAGLSGLGVVRGLMPDADAPAVPAPAPGATSGQAANDPAPVEVAEAAPEPVVTESQKEPPAEPLPAPANDDRPPQPPPILGTADMATLEQIRDALGGAPVLPPARETASRPARTRSNRRRARRPTRTASSRRRSTPRRSSSGTPRSSPKRRPRPHLRSNRTC